MKKLTFMLVMLFAGIMAAQAQMPTDNSYLRENYRNSKTAQRAAEKKALKQARKEAKKAAKEQAKLEKQKNKDTMKAMKLTPAMTKPQTSSTSVQPTTVKTQTQPVIYVKTKEGKVTTQDKAQNEAVAKVTPYLAGAVPTTAEGIVYFERTIPYSGKTKQQAYDIIKDLAEQKINESQHLNISRILSESPDTLVASICEPIYFKRKKWEADSTIMKYQYLANVKDTEATVRIWFISYCYEQGLDKGFNYKAEEWITDKYGLTRDKLSLSKVTGKFRRMTIDYTNEIFTIIEERLKGAQK